MIIYFRRRDGQRRNELSRLGTKNNEFLLPGNTVAHKYVKPKVARLIPFA